MKWKLLILFTCVLLLVAFSIPVMQNAVLSPVVSYGSQKGSINWQVKVDNAQGYAIAVTPDESYIYVAGAEWVDPSNSNKWKPALWKYTNSGTPVWHTIVENIQEYSIFGDVAVSPDGSSVYAAGLYINGTVESPYYPYIIPLLDAILVSFNASTGDIDWNYTLNGPADDRIEAVAVSRNGKQVYLAGTFSKSMGWYNNSFYVAALNSSDGSPSWIYEFYVLDSSGYVNDLEVSPSGEAIYVAGSYGIQGSTDLNLLVLDTTNGSPLWNLTSTMYFAFDGVEVSSDGERIYTLASGYEHLLTYDSSKGSLLHNVSINRMGSHSSTIPFVFALSPDESKIYIPRENLGLSGEYMLLIAFECSSGEPVSFIKAINPHTWPDDLVASRDNKHVYIAGRYDDVATDKYYMFLLKVQPGPFFPSLLFLIMIYTTIYQNQIFSSSINSFLIGIGIATVIGVTGLAIAIIVKERESQNV